MAVPQELLRDDNEENKDPNGPSTPSFLKVPCSIATAKPMAVLRPRPIPAPVPRVSHINWSLKTSATFAVSKSLHSLKHFRGRSSDVLTECLGYYRFPFPCISEGIHRRISNLYLQPRKKHNPSDKTELEFYEQLIGSWRKSLLSLYEIVKSTKGSFFYYFQQEFCAIFRHERDEGMNVVLCKCNETVRSMLDREGIRYELLDAVVPVESKDENDVIGEVDELEGVYGGNEIEEIEASTCEEEDDESSNCAELIRAEISERLKRRRLTRIQKRSAYQGTILVRDAHSFLDYLINQKNGRSYIVLPELVSPMPFLYGTFCKNEMVVHGADVQGGLSRLKVNGTVMPDAVCRIKMVLAGMLEEEPSLAVEEDSRTSPFSRLDYSL